LFTVSECYKRFYNLAKEPPLYFWRDQAQNEIDLLIFEEQKAFPIEIKLSQSFHADFKKSIVQWLELSENPADRGAVLYCGEKIDIHKAIPAYPWYNL
jgi:predicted AAA+ superfamily ATPase